MATVPVLAPLVQQSLDAFVADAKTAFDTDLISVVLFGSAAEGKLRATSDVNLILVLKSFNQQRVDTLRESYRTAHATIKLELMFLLQSEIDAAMTAFAVKFSDIIGRHQVIHGADPFANLTISREATLHRLKQVLMNQILRLRERYALVSLREEQLALVIADAAGPLRASAASILALDGQQFSSPKEALEKIAASLGSAKWEPILKNLSTAREQQQLSPGQAGSTLLALIELAQALYARVAKLA